MITPSLAATVAALPDAVTWDGQLPGADSARVSAAEIAQFKSQGFLVKRALIPEIASLAQIRRYLWARVPRGIITESDADTWLDKPHRKWTAEDGRRVGVLSRGNLKMRSRTIGTETFLVDATARHPQVLCVVEQLLGTPLKPVGRVRGIYLILPRPPEVSSYLGPHVDDQAAQLGAMVLLDDIPPRSGGFTIWPGSHLSMRDCWTASVGGRIDQDHFEALRGEVLAGQTPLEFTGSAGDVVFWHGRLLHSGGINHSVADGRAPVARMIVPCDFQRGGKTYFDDDVTGPGANVQWWVDTRNFREDPSPTAENTWWDWAI